MTADGWTRCVARLAAAVLLAAVAAVPQASAQDETPRLYLRAAAGYEWSRDASLLDRSCDPAPLLNYFGCQAGEDGRRLGAYGDFGHGLAGEIAVGARIVPALRVELALSHRPGFRFNGNANFLASGVHQPVSADLIQSAVMGRTFLDLAPFIKLGRIEPFLGAGVGLGRNRIAGVKFVFPELPANPATTTITGGTHWGVAWDLSPGTAVRVAPHTLLELSYRYSHFGQVETGDGPIDVVRGTRSLRIENVAGTRSQLSTHGLYVGVRHEL